MRKTIHDSLMRLKNKNWFVLALNAMAVVTVIQNMNTGCAWLDHQPEIPKEAKRFRTF